MRLPLSVATISRRHDFTQPLETKPLETKKAGTRPTFSGIPPTGTQTMRHVPPMRSLPIDGPISGRKPHGAYISDSSDDLTKT